LVKTTPSRLNRCAFAVETTVVQMNRGGPRLPLDPFLTVAGFSMANAATRCGYADAQNIRF
jgi:hypothetical protein